MPRREPAPAPLPVPAPAALPAGAEPCVLLKHGEVFLRGRNRDRHEERLRDNLRQAVRDLPGTVRIRRAQGYTVLGGDAPQPELIARARRVMGFNVVQPALRLPSRWEDLCDAATAVLAAAAAVRPGLSFAVRARRRDKDFPLTSTQAERELGARLQQRLGLPVDLRAPGVTLVVEIGRPESYLSWERLPGQGGLPVGSGGRALVLLSGGYDSPLAAHRAVRRGLACDFVHFTGAPYTNAASVYKAYALAREVNRYQPPGRLHVIALGEAQKQLAIAGAGRLQVVAQRRLMVRTAAALAGRLRADALVTGDSLGQVASQTVANLAAVDEASPLPVLRPLLTWEKQEIIDEARAIGTAEISVLPDEDCCALLAPPQVVTRAHLPDLARVERRLDTDEIIAELLRSAQVMRPGVLEETPGPEAAPPGPGAAACRTADAAGAGPGLSRTA